MMDAFPSDQPLRFNTLMISETSPDPHYGGGQRMMMWREIFSRFGECRYLQLLHDPKDRSPSADFELPPPFNWQSSRLEWTRRHLSFATYRPHPERRAILAPIRAQFAFDLIFGYHFQVTPFFPVEDVPCMLDIDIAPSPNGRLQRAIWPATRSMVRRRADQLDQLYVIRPGDAALLGDPGSPRIRFVPGLSMNAETAETAERERSGALLIGSVKWEPNLRAMEMLIARGIPDALAARGEVLTLIGAGTERFKGVPGIEAFGFVDSLAPFYARAAIVLCPIQGRDGANIKLAEAIQCGSVVLASPDAASGYAGALEPGRDFATYPTEDDLRGSLERLLDDLERRTTLRSHARARAVDTLNIDAFAKQVEADCRRAFANRGVDTRALALRRSDTVP